MQPAVMSPELKADGLKADAMRFALCHFSSAKIRVNRRLSVPLGISNRGPNRD